MRAKYEKKKKTTNHHLKRIHIARVSRFANIHSMHSFVLKSFDCYG